MTSLVYDLVNVPVSLHGDDDFGDKISSRYSVILLVIFCSIVSTKQYVGNPIDCWVSTIHPTRKPDHIMILIAG